MLGSLISGVFGLGSALIGANTSSSNTRATNAQNAYQFEMSRRDAQEENWKQREFAAAQLDRQNRYNTEQANAQRDWLERMQNEANAYNTPLAQMNRYREAGINPYFALGSVQPGQTSVQAYSAPTSGSGGSAGGSVASPIPMQTTDYAPYFQMATQSVQGAVNSYFANAKLREESKNVAIQNITQLQRDKAQLAQSLSNTKLTDKQRESIEQQMKRYDELIDSQLKSATEDVEVKKAQRSLMAIQEKQTSALASYQEMVNKAFPKLNEAQLKQVQATIRANNASAYAAYESGKLSAAQASTEAVRKTQEELRNKGIIMDNAYIPKLKHETLRNMKLANRLERQKINSNLPDEIFGDAVGRSKEYGFGVLPALYSVGRLGGSVLSGAFR